MFKITINSYGTIKTEDKYQYILTWKTIENETHNIIEKVCALIISQIIKQIGIKNIYINIIDLKKNSEKEE